MKTYGVAIPDNNGELGALQYFKTDASIENIESSIAFIKHGKAKDLNGLLIALRLMGFNARPINVDTEQVFEM